MSIAVVREVVVPDFLRFLDPVVLVPQPPQRDAPLSIVVIVTEDASLVAAVSAIVPQLLGVMDPTSISITTSENIALLRAAIEGQLGDFGRELAIAILSLTSILVAAILYAIVMLRRRDFGRRRALGASQPLIICLLIVQTAIVGLAGVMLGTFTAIIALVSSGDPLPDVDFVLGVAVLAMVSTLLSTVGPALVAATRDPLRELRVP